MYYGRAHETSMIYTTSWTHTYTIHPNPDHGHMLYLLIHDTRTIRIPTRALRWDNWGGCASTGRIYGT